MKIKPFEIWRKNLEEIETHLFQNSADKLLCAIFFWNVAGAMQKQLQMGKKLQFKVSKKASKVFLKYSSWIDVY